MNHPVQDLVAKWKRLRAQYGFRRAPIRTVSRLISWRIKCSTQRAATVRLPRWDLQVFLPAIWHGIGRSIFAFREHYEPELDYLPSLLFPGGTFVDIGANLGVYTLVASRIVGHLGHVFAFEPSAQSFPLLQKNIALNRLKNVSAFPVALAAETGKVRLYHAPCCPSGNSFGRHPSFHEGFENVDAKSLDDALLRIPSARIDVIKMDVQGAEELVLRGGLKVIALMKPQIIFEIWPEGADVLGLSPCGAWNLLEGLGYQFFSVSSATKLESPPTESAYANVLAIHQEKLQVS